MTVGTRQQVDRARAELAMSELPAESRDPLYALLDTAETAANGCPEAERASRLAEAFLCLAVFEARQATWAPAAMRAEVARHVGEQCPLGAGGTGKAAFWRALAMKPWPWIAASVAAFSPNAPAIVAAIQTAFK